MEQLRIEVQDFERSGQDVESLLLELDGLREDLLQLDVQDVGRPSAGPAPPGTRSSALEQVNALLVTLTAVPALLLQVVTVVKNWRGRAADSAPSGIVLTLGDQRLEISGGDAEQQRVLTAMWIEACTAREERGASSD
ncbi:hypothetical protein [Streptomyces phaeoluteigriseus]|uniref:hypothetical protein n=1 Tax=Streptomyces phaeoluteigriseus TaxID=114686 RepID=UPI00369A363A